MKVKNSLVVILSLLAIVCIVLTFVVNWIFLIIAVILVIINERQLMRKKK
ncbi:MAG: hypothetical protein WAU65_01325 [Candidatus Nanoarchaeia archaeon]